VTAPEQPTPPAGTEVRILEAQAIVGRDDPPWIGTVNTDQDQTGRLYVHVTQAADPGKWIGYDIYADAWELASDPPALRLPDGWERTGDGDLRCQVGFGDHAITVRPEMSIRIDVPYALTVPSARHIAARLVEAADIVEQFRAGAR
jgi:hypothetical protein